MNPPREEQVEETRARIAETALELFVGQGYAETTIDQIADASGVGRRTVFRYFPTKAAMLFDQLAVRREVALERLRERPTSEPPLVSLHTVLRELCAEGYDRGLLAQIRAVLASDPHVAGRQLSDDIGAFEHRVIGVLQERPGQRASQIELGALTKMACSWFVTAAHIYLVENRRSLVKCFDEVVSICADSLDVLS